MILDEKIHIKVNPSQLKYLRNKGYEVSSGDEIDLPVSDLNDGSHLKVRVKCDVCGKEKMLPYRRYIQSYSKGGYYSCSSSCGKKKREQTFLERYGHITHLVTEQTKEKIKNTFKEKHGVEHFTKTKEYQARKNNIVNKRKKTIYQDYIKNENIIDINDETLKKKCDKCGKVYEIDKKLYHNRKQIGVDTICVLCNPYSENRSFKEKEVYEHIRSVYDGEVIKNFKLNRNEIDVYIPELKIGFEFNGLYWHSELHKPNDYHQNKTEFFQDKGIQVIHIYEDDWVYKKDIVKSRIKNVLGLTTKKIYARKCEIKKIDSKTANNFLYENHIQGRINSPIHYGLFYNNVLLSVMSFSKLRRSLGYKDGDGYELTRFCNKINHSVTGGASKLLKRFMKEYDPKNLISYADRSWSVGNLYEKLGFEFVRKTKPNYYYVVSGKRENRFRYRKDKLVKERYDKSKTEHQIMMERKIYRIYNSGSLLYRFIM